MMNNCYDPCRYNLRHGKQTNPKCNNVFKFQAFENIPIQ